jgi:phosphoserine aminotransferase
MRLFEIMKLRKPRKARTYSREAIKEILFVSVMNRRHRDEDRKKIAEDVMSDAREIFPTHDLPTVDEILAMKW